MPTQRETGKDRWRRVPKNYFKSPDRLQRAKLLGSALALVLALGWFALGIDWKSPASTFSSTDLNSLRANHGTLARVHATWDNKCEACHVPFEPIDGRSLFASTSSVPNRSSDKLCMSCHAGPLHHSATFESEVKGCAECHRDHQGRDASLVRLADRECTRCHSEIERHVDSSKKMAGSRKFLDVTGFDKDSHPPFQPEATVVVASKLQDRGKLKFNHARHMMPGIVKKPGDEPYTVANIPVASERPRYQKDGQPTDPVQLDCSTCHQLDAAEGSALAPANPAVAASILPVRNPGRYYLPITFENQCRACHVLSFDPSKKDVEVPHGVQPDRVASFINEFYAAQVLADDPKILDAFVPPVRLPGKSPVPRTAKQKLDESVSNALTFLFPKDVAAGSPSAGNSNNCLECHAYGKPGEKDIPTSVEPTKVPQVWFTHASFDHSAHRGVSCRECHPGSYAMGEDGKSPNPLASVAATDVLIPGIDNCVQCHAPAKGSGGWFGTTSRGSISGGASIDCNECHRYHNGDRLLQGLGASAEDATAERTVAEFLRGTGGQPRPSTSAKSP